MSIIVFSLTNTTPLTFKVCGMREAEDTLPTYLTKDMIVTLVSGKWPLHDYNDCDCHTFVFQKTDGSQFILLLSGFTYACGFPKEKQQAFLDEGHTSIKISLLEIKNSNGDSDDGMSHPESE